MHKGDRRMLLGISPELILRPTLPKRTAKEFAMVVLLGFSSKSQKKVPSQDKTHPYGKALKPSTQGLESHG